MSAFRITHTRKPEPPRSPRPLPHPPSPHNVMHLHPVAQAALLARPSSTNHVRPTPILPIPGSRSSLPLPAQRDAPPPRSASSLACEAILNRSRAPYTHTPNPRPTHLPKTCPPTPTLLPAHSSVTRRSARATTAAQGNTLNSPASSASAISFSESKSNSCASRSSASGAATGVAPSAK